MVLAFDNAGDFAKAVYGDSSSQTAGAIVQHNPSATAPVAMSGGKRKRLSQRRSQRQNGGKNKKQSQRQNGGKNKKQSQRQNGGKNKKQSQRQRGGK
jgi:hypothetical protein